MPVLIPGIFNLRILVYHKTSVFSFAFGLMVRKVEKMILKSFVTQSKKILGDNLVGIYLHGSAVMGCYNEKKSDIDLLVVVKEAVPDVPEKYHTLIVQALDEYLSDKETEWDENNASEYAAYMVSQIRN